MKRLISGIVAAAALFVFATPTFAASPMPMASAAMSTGSMMKSSMKTMKCPKGQMMVKGYTKKDGTKVAAYCRKSAM